MLYPISLHMGISIGWHLPSPGRSMSMELIPPQQRVSQHSTTRVRTNFPGAGPIAAATRGAGARVRPAGARRRARRGAEREAAQLSGRTAPAGDGIAPDLGGAAGRRGAAAHGAASPAPLSAPRSSASAPPAARGGGRVTSQRTGKR